MTLWIVGIAVIAWIIISSIILLSLCIVASRFNNGELEEEEEKSVVQPHPESLKIVKERT